MHQALAGQARQLIFVGSAGLKKDLDSGPGASLISFGRLIFIGIAATGDGRHGV